MDEGYYSYDEWNDYSDLSEVSGSVDYDTSMCFIEELVDTYGWDDFYLMIERLRKFQTGELVEHSTVNYLFVEEVLEYVYGDEVLDILEKYGIEEEDYEDYAI